MGLIPIVVVLDVQVGCDECGKWRRLPRAVASAMDLDTVKWYCASNPDPALASCSVPQELTDEQIDLEIMLAEQVILQNARRSLCLRRTEHHWRACTTLFLRSKPTRLAVAFSAPIFLECSCF